MKSAGSCWIPLLLILVAPEAAAQVFPAPGKATRAGLEAFLKKHDDWKLVSSLGVAPDAELLPSQASLRQSCRQPGCHCRVEFSYKAGGASTGSSKCSWRIENNHIHIQSDVIVNPFKGTKIPWSLQVEVLGLTPQMLVLPTGVMRCDVEERPRTCLERLGTHLRPGAKDRALFEQVKARLEKSSSLGDRRLANFFVVEGPAPKNSRTTTEIWYQGDEWMRECARRYAEKLAGLIGPVEPREWTWGGPWSIIIIAGEKKAD